MMANWAILATGPSMSLAVAQSVREQNVIVVSDAYRLAGWADVLVSQDKAWWNYHKDALLFPGRKFSTNEIEGVEKFHSYEAVGQAFGTGCNSGLLACLVAQWLGAKRIELHGFDMGGTHFFGEHPKPLKNANAHRFAAMCADFKRWNHDGIEVINMTPGSALDCFPRGV
jgi:hypothetical protein